MQAKTPNISLGVPSCTESQMTILDRPLQFISHSWERLFQLLMTSIKFSLAYHPKPDGQVERLLN